MLAECLHLSTGTCVQTYVFMYAHGNTSTQWYTHAYKCLQNAATFLPRQKRSCSSQLTRQNTLLFLYHLQPSQSLLHFNRGIPKPQIILHSLLFASKVFAAVKRTDDFWGLEQNESSSQVHQGWRGVARTRQEWGKRIMKGMSKEQVCFKFQALVYFEACFESIQLHQYCARIDACKNTFKFCLWGS